MQLFSGSHETYSLFTTLCRVDSYQTSLQTNWRQTKLSFTHQLYIVVPLKIDKHLKILWMGGLQRQQKFKDMRTQIDI